ncbi:hypothetical protein A8C56_17920 [Niabella ginsenosidivorans]|uniref:Uncharacterized protein n=1 Tax=Niabella ginsenosidivorans TaxID=1176587 RepID=A0A1A9I7G9_9BACT|nr:DUF4173 domain-containing protein [Niabella ginsenosidivorans]ANH82602.1 hypothetical protein A8C56_17920 [Niabella ginsenosidivorans]
MKKNIALFTGVAAFVALFYGQEVGLNGCLLALLLWIFLLITSEKSGHTPQFRWLSGALLVSVCAFAWYGDFISFAAVFSTLVLLVCKVSTPFLNVLLVPLAAAVNFMSFVFRAPFVGRWLPVNSLFKGHFYKQALYYFLIPGVLAIGFIAVYSASSNLFQSFFHFNWNADFFQVLFLSIAGFFIMFSFLHYWAPEALISYNEKLGDHFSTEMHRMAANEPQLHFYRKSGEISLILLNGIVVFFIITYCVEHFGSEAADNSLSDALHERVYLLIFSIIMAISVIMLFFKGGLNFDTKAGLLKTGAFTWILLNGLLVAIVALKNNQYVAAYGLTFKRVGVYIFLLLCAAGLVLTALKIKKQRTNCFLLNRMVWLVYGTLIIGCAINWSWIVTRYNLSHASALDKNYLYHLPYNKQLLYNARLLPATELNNIKSEHTARPFLSQRLYYRLLNP